MHLINITRKGPARDCQAQTSLFLNFYRIFTSAHGAGAFTTLSPKIYRGSIFYPIVLSILVYHYLPLFFILSFVLYCPCWTLFLFIPEVKITGGVFLFYFLLSLISLFPYFQFIPGEFLIKIPFLIRFSDNGIFRNLNFCRLFFLWVYHSFISLASRFKAR